MEEKKCFYCKKMIPKKAMICPYCESRTGRGCLFKILLAFLISLGFIIWWAIII